MILRLALFALPLLCWAQSQQSIGPWPSIAAAPRWWLLLHASHLPIEEQVYVHAALAMEPSTGTVALETAANAAALPAIALSNPPDSPGVSVTLKPLSLSSTAAVFSNNRVGVWTVGICNDYLRTVTLDRARILNAAPGLSDLPNDVAQDLLTRRANTSFWSVVSSAGKEILGLAPVGLSAAGFATNSRTLNWAGVGAGVLAYFVMRATTRAPNPAPYFTKLLPDRVTIPPGACLPDYWLAASLQKGAKAISLKLDVPVQ